MGLQRFLMKHGMGSPGYIAGRLAEAYRTRKANSPGGDHDRSILRAIFVERVAAQSSFGGPEKYKSLRGKPEAIEELIDRHPDLFSIVILAIVIEHPELVGPYANPDTFGALIETVQEVLDRKVSGWRTSGIWDHPDIVCSLCDHPITDPDPSLMYAVINEERQPEYLCAQCSMPLPMRAIADLGYFRGNV